MLNLNLKNVSASNYNKPGPGGYVIQITKAHNNSKLNRVEFEFDFAEGQFAGYYKEVKDKFNFWGGRFYKFYTERALPFFKKFVDTLVECNPDIEGIIVGDWDDIDEEKMVGARIGMIVGEKVYIGKDGKIKTDLDTYNAQFVTIETIYNEDYAIPEKVDETGGATKAKGVGNVTDTTIPGFEATLEAIKDDEIPF